MRIKFTLTMDDLRVRGRSIKKVIMEWIDDVDDEYVLRLSKRWLNSNNFLTSVMEGLERVGESSLEIEPVEDE